MSRWYRAYEGTVTDAKLAEVALIAGCSRSVAIAAWHCVLEACAATNDGGRFECTARRLAVILCEPVAAMEGVLTGFAEVRLIEGDKVPAWNARQFVSDTSTERSRKHREKRRNGDATLQGRCSNAPYTETETEQKEDVGERAKTAPSYADFERSLRSAAGNSLNSTSAGLMVLSEPYRWLSEGCDMDLDIIPTLRALGGRSEPGEIASWGYFAKAVFKAKAARLRPAPQIATIVQHGKPHGSAFATVFDDIRSEIAAGDRRGS